MQKIDEIKNIPYFLPVVYISKTSGGVINAPLCGFLSNEKYEYIRSYCIQVSFRRNSQMDVEQSLHHGRLA